MGEKIVIIGAGGFAREVLDIFDACNEAGKDYEVLGYVVEAQYGSPGTSVNNKPILGDFNWIAQHAEEAYAICAVGTPALRMRLVRRAQEVGARFSNVVHPSAILTPWVNFKKGVVIAAGCILTNQIQLGNHVHINLGCTIGHDAILQDFVTLAPGVHVSGKVTLSTGAYVGTGANIVEGVNVGEWSILGAGSTITRNVPPNATVVGVRGKVIKTRETGWHLK
jgi:sugar O-acyltransferase (sialic acid O-acetyltransferase NeuD family)